MYCESGTVALFRRSLFEFADTDRHFTQKSPDDVHRHEYVFKHNLLNRGMGSHTDVCLPKFDNTFPNQVFSLSQLWCTAGNRSDNDNSFQSVEAGWHVFPELHGDYYPRLFVFWTPDNYTTRIGSYAQNEKQKVGFIPNPSSKFAPRMTLSPLSVLGDKNQQYVIILQWKLVGGAWWLKLGEDKDPKEDAKHWVGHYPTALFGVNGKLASSADAVAFGGETCCNRPKLKPIDPAPPPLIFPPMGTGSLPTGNYNDDFSKVTYHSHLFYYGPDTKLNFLQPKDLSWYGSYREEDKRYALRQAPTPDKKRTYYFFGGPGGPDPAPYKIPPGDRLSSTHGD
jgi:hypothetical protein